MDSLLLATPTGFAHAVGDYLLKVGSNVHKHKEMLLVFKDVLQSYAKRPDVELTVLAAKCLKKVVDVGQMRKQRKVMHKKGVLQKQMGKTDTTGKTEAALRLKEYALYCFLFETVRLGKDTLGEGSVLAISEMAKAVGNSLLIFAESSGADAPRLAERSQALVHWEKTKTCLRVVQYGASVLNAVVTVVGMTSMFSGDSDPLEEVQRKSSLVVTTFSVAGSAIAVYENRGKIYAVAQGVFKKAYGLFPAGVAESVRKVSAIGGVHLFLK